MKTMYKLQDIEIDLLTQKYEAFTENAVCPEDMSESEFAFHEGTRAVVKVKENIAIRTDDRRRLVAALNTLREESIGVQEDNYRNGISDAIALINGDL